MRPIYMHISYIYKNVCKKNETFVYGGSVFKFDFPMTIEEINVFVSNALSKKFGIEIKGVQIMSMSVLPKRVYKMLKGI